MIVRKLNHRGTEVWRYPAEVVRQEPNCIVIEARFNRDDMDLGYTTFQRGDRFVEFFFRDRWYNIFAVYAKGEGRLRGWYCNICRPAVWDETVIACEDLELDVWIPPTGDPIILDRDEFDTLNLDEEERQNALKGVDEILTMARTQSLPT